MVDHVLCPSETIVMQERNIICGVVSYMKPSMRFTGKTISAVIFKRDFVKHYDKVKWMFIRWTLRMKDLFEKWCAWVDNLKFGYSVAIKVNENVGHYYL